MPDPYCTIEHIKSRIPEKTLIQLTDDERLGVVNTAEVDKAISRGGRVIDSKCGIRYLVPFASPSEVITDINADLAAYYLYARKAEKMPEVRADEYKNANLLLDQIAAGKASPGEAALPEAAPEENRGGPAFRAPDIVFTKEKLAGF